MADDNEFMANVSIEESSEYLSRKEIGFSIHDSIFSPFPDLELVYPDLSGLALEYGSFMQGIKIKTVLGTAEKMLETNWCSAGRDTIKEAGSAPRLSGVLKVYALHESYFSNRENPKKSFIEQTVSDCVSDLFSGEKDLDIEATKGKICTYAFHDPYEVVKDILIPAATNGKISPYLFFRDLSGTLHFCSLEKLLTGSAVASFELKANLSEQDDESHVVTGFLPFNERAGQVYPFMRTTGKYFTADQEFTQEEKSIATEISDKIPFLSENKVDHYVYFGRQFNPKVEYNNINTGLFASSMKFILDKALCTVPYCADCVAGKVVELKINALNSEGNEQLSEFYSGNWLIEQSYHCWNGENSRPFTKLVLCRQEVKPVKDSILETRAFKD